MGMGGWGWEPRPIGGTGPQTHKREGGGVEMGAQAHRWEGGLGGDPGPTSGRGGLGMETRTHKWDGGVWGWDPRPVGGNRGVGMGAQTHRWEGTPDPQVGGWGGDGATDP